MEKILLISSSGGHWVQMNRLLPALEGHDLYYACTEKSYCQHVPEGRFFHVVEASQTNKFKLVLQAFTVLSVLLRLRPTVILTTGAAPGFFALLFGKRLGAKTIWLDSIANVNELSLAGKKAAKHADLYMTQWEHLASPERGPQFSGTVI